MDKSIIEEIEHRFNFTDFQETLNLPEESRKTFLGWFAQIAEGFTVVETVPEDSKKEMYIGNRCFGNALLFAKENNADYFEGFVRLGGRVIHHGFAVKDGIALDVTRDYRSPDFEESWTIDSQYWGIKIPEDQLLKIDEQKHDPHFNDPQIITLFKSQN